MRTLTIVVLAIALVAAIGGHEISSLQADNQALTEAYEQAEAGRQDLGAALYALMGAYNERVPACQEDQVLVGKGDFEDGRWSRYACGPALDDYRGGTQ